ncbi:MAG: MucB/RseB C-terminal domain-containing protein [Gammaproteobacteria bacterium]
MKTISSKVPSIFFRPFFLSSLLCCLTAAVSARETGVTAQELLDRMAHATYEMNYDGTFIYRQGKQMDTMRLIHKFGEDGENERIVSLTGHEREVIRNNQSVTCIFPDSHSVMVDKVHAQKLLPMPEDLDRLTAHYTLAVAGEDRIAGKEAWIVTIRPDDRFRYGYQLWIGKTDHLLLKSELKNSSGYILEQILFTRLDVLDNIPDEWLKSSISGAGYTRYDSTAPEHPAEATNGNHWTVMWMPNGFSMSNHAKQAVVASDNLVDHMVYTDGLAMVSVFIERIKDPSQFVPGPSRIGAVNAFAKLTNGYQVTAVGEVPQTTVQKMAISVVTGNSVR